MKYLRRAAAFILGCVGIVAFFAMIGAFIAMAIAVTLANRVAED